MLAHAVVDVAPAVVAGLHRAAVLYLGERRGLEIGRAAHEMRHVVGNPLDHLLRRLASGHIAVVRVEARDVGVPAVGAPTLTDQLELRRRLRLGVAERGEPLLPVVHELLPALARLLRAGGPRLARRRPCPPASRRPPSSASPRPRRAASRAPSACPACSASRSRYASARSRARACHSRPWRSPPPVRGSRRRGPPPRPARASHRPRSACPRPR